jgi:hypothetical protein
MLIQWEQLNTQLNLVYADHDCTLHKSVQYIFKVFLFLIFTELDLKTLKHEVHINNARAIQKATYVEEGQSSCMRGSVT